MNFLSTFQFYINASMYCRNWNNEFLFLETLGGYSKRVSMDIKSLNFTATFDHFDILQCTIVFSTISVFHNLKVLNFFFKTTTSTKKKRFLILIIRPFYCFCKQCITVIWMIFKLHLISANRFLIISIRGKYLNWWPFNWCTTRKSCRKWTLWMIYFILHEYQMTIRNFKCFIAFTITVIHIESEK